MSSNEKSNCSDAAYTHETAEKKKVDEELQRLVALSTSFLNSTVVAFIESVPQLHKDSPLPSKQTFASIIELEENKQAFQTLFCDFDDKICKFVCDENGAKAREFAAMLLKWRRSVPCTETDLQARMVHTVMTLVLDLYVYFVDNFIHNK